MSRAEISGTAIAMITIATLAGAAAGCTVGPNYKRPPVTAPDTFRGTPVGPPSAAPSIADARWSQLFQDQPLQTLITTALAENFDLRIAASRILQAQALYRVTRADQFPTVNGEAQGQGQRGTVIAGQSLPTTGSAQLGVSLSWELDFWGKYRRASEAARAEILATEWGRRAFSPAS
jgi:multidrug efflux system outer membrane protein